MVTQMGRKSKQEGICVYTWLIHFAVQQKLTQQCKVTNYMPIKKINETATILFKGIRMSTAQLEIHESSNVL